MTQTTLETLAAEDAFCLIGKEWMLITAGTPEKFNMMTASWGGIGWLWNKPVAFIFVRPERFTYQFTEQSGHITLSFFGSDPSLRKMLSFCGSASGRDHDKAAESGLTPVATAHGAVTFSQSRLVIEGRKLFRSEFRPENFLDAECLDRWYSDQPGGTLHTMYILEIENVYKG